MASKKFDNLEQQFKTLQFRFNLVVVVFAVLIVANLGIFAYIKYDLQQTKSAPNESEVTQLTANTAQKKNYTTSITSFYNNSSVSEVGYQLELKKQSISTKNTTNCFTPEVPPLKNGCGFVIRPYASGIQPVGSYLHNLIIKAKIGPGDKIAVDIKDSEKNEVTKSLGIIEAKQTELSTLLPSTLKQNEQILLRLWPEKGSEITVEEIYIESFDLNKLQETSLKLSPELVAKYQGKSANIYLDSDKNGKLDPSVDKKWDCVNGFPGVQPTKIEKDTVALVRNDSCVTRGYPQAWKKDSGKLSLPTYHWLVTVDQPDNKLDIYSFETVDGVKEYEII
jgi:hypothetical protein